MRVRCDACGRSGTLDAEFLCKGCAQDVKELEPYEQDQEPDDSDPVDL